MSKIRPETKDAIIEAAFEVFSESPTSSLSDVAVRAGVGRATLHRHFASRAALMHALAKTALAELEDAVQHETADASSYAEAFRQSFHAIVPLANRQWFLAHEDLEDDPAVAAAYAESHAELLRDIEAAKTEGIFDPMLPTAWIANVYDNLVYAAWTLVRSGDATQKQAAELAWRTLKSGVSGDGK
ncbi:MAG: TetR/AcrR family transcriptional regulator [Pseudomonadota bacterium]